MGGGRKEGEVAWEKKKRVASPLHAKVNEVERTGFYVLLLRTHNHPFIGLEGVWIVPYIYSTVLVLRTPADYSQKY